MTTQQQRYQDVRKVTLIGSALDFMLGVAKIVMGWLSNSQALIADGIHSFSDLLTDFMVLYAAKHSHKAADEAHPYGHGRIETLATVSLGMVLVIVALGIATSAIQRLDDPNIALDFSTLAILVACVSVISKEWIYRYTIKAARRLRSDMLAGECMAQPLGCLFINCGGDRHCRCHVRLSLSGCNRRSGCGCDDRQNRL